MVNLSYDGIPGGGTARGLSKSTLTKEGTAGGVIGLVYMSTFVVPERMSLLGFVGGHHAPRVRKNQVSSRGRNVSPLLTLVLLVQSSYGLGEIADAIETLYGRLDADTASRLDRMLLPHALKAFESLAPQPVWAMPAFQGKVACLKCMQDPGLPPVVQDIFMKRSGIEWMVKDIEASHSAYVRKSARVGACFRRDVCLKEMGFTTNAASVDARDAQGLS